MHSFILLLPTALDPPRNVTVVATTDTTATLSWLPPLNIIGEVQLYRVTLDFEVSVVQNTTGNETTLTVTGLEPGSEYLARVEALSVSFGPPSSPEVTVLTRECRSCNSGTLLHDHIHLVYCTSA